MNALLRLLSQHKIAQPAKNNQESNSPSASVGISTGSSASSAHTATHSLIFCNDEKDSIQNHCNNHTSL